MLSACADLAERAGANEVEFGYVRDDVPVEEAGWYARAHYRGFTLTADDHQSPGAAATALAERLLTGAICRCRQAVTLSPDKPGCVWRLVGATWVPGCDVPSIFMGPGQRGDLAAMQRRLEQPC